MMRRKRCRTRLHKPRAVHFSGVSISKQEEEEDGAAAGTSGAAAGRGPEAAGDLLPEAAGGAGQEGRGARRALRRPRRAPRRQPLRRHLPPLLRAGNRRSKDFQIPMATTERSLCNDDILIDELSISQLTIEQLSRIERKVEYALRKTKARKLEAQRIFTVQEKGKGVLEEKNLMKMISGEEQDLGRYGTGSQQRDSDLDLTLRLHTDIGCDSGGLRRHEMLINLNLP